MQVRDVIPSVTDDCPKGLRLVLQKWESGKATNAELIEASYFAQLDMIDEYRKKPLPSAPQNVLAYRNLKEDEKRIWSIADKRQLILNNQTFYDSESKVVAQNESNRLTLEELLVWVESKGLKPAVDRIETLLDAWTLRPAESY